MTEIWRADPAARRQAVLLVTLVTFVGVVLIVGFERVRAPLIDWLLTEPDELPQRVKVVILLAAAVLSAPLVGFAVYLWSLGAKVLRAGEFPLPGQRVIRDTQVIEDRPWCCEGAASRFWRPACLSLPLICGCCFGGWRYFSMKECHDVRVGWRAGDSGPPEA